MSEIEKVYEVNPYAVTLRGRWKLTLESGGVIKQETSGENVVCTNGKEFLASFLKSAAAAASTFTCRYVAIGTDATAEAAANTALGTELARVSGIVSYVSNQIYQVTATFASGTGTGAIVEYGLLSSSTGGTLLSRDTEAVINKGANDSLTAVVQITVS
jgi:hypothetical protein